MESRFAFSETLLHNTIAYFAQKYGMTLDPETAQDFLHAYTELYGAFARGIASEAQAGHAQSAALPASDLITTHSC